MVEKTEQDFYVNKAYNGLADILNADKALIDMGNDTITRAIIVCGISRKSLVRLIYMLDAIERESQNEEEQGL